MNSEISNLKSEIPLVPGLPVKIIGGKFNGFTGTLGKTCDTWCSVFMEFERTFHEIVVELKFIAPMEAWLAGKSPTELQLHGHGPQAS